MLRITFKSPRSQNVTAGRIRSVQQTQKESRQLYNGQNFDEDVSSRQCRLAKVVSLQICIWGKLSSDLAVIKVIRLEKICYFNSSSLQ